MSDGLLLNLSFAPKPKKPEQPQQQTRQRSLPPSRSSRPSANSRNDLKRKPRDTARPLNQQKHKSDESGRSSGRPAKRQRPNQDKDKNTFVSSLFTSNPAGSKEETSTDNVVEHSKAQATNAPVEGLTFESLGLNSGICTQLKDKMNLTRPTLIQRRSIPPLITSDRDLFVQAQTGSGKTLSYVLPIIQRMMACSPEIHRESGLFAIILAPTRELSNQIYSVLENVLRACHRIVPGIVIGGEKKKSEKARIRKGINILVATPGRLADHFDNTESLDLSELRWLVLDEGDRLMELGFEETIDKILDTISKRSQIKESKFFAHLPKTRVNVLCSATMKNNVKELGELSLSNALWVGVNPQEKDQEEHDMIAAMSASSSSPSSSSSATAVDYSAPAQLIQQSLIVPAKLRLVTLAGVLMDLAKYRKGARIMVFLSCSDSVDFHYSVFAGKRDSDDDDDDAKGKLSNTVRVSSVLSDTIVHKLHGSLDQQTRTSTLASFAKNSKSDDTTLVLFCTDVASRGLDLPFITNVIEYDAPFSTDDHVHRVGRTARAGKEGSSVLFLLPGDEENYLDRIAHNHPQGIHERNYKEILRRAFGSHWESDATTWHLDNERWFLEDSSMLQMAKRAYTSHLRAYATHLSSERDCFNIKTLHLGHVAKSFGLRDAPTNIKGVPKTAGQMSTTNTKTKAPKKPAMSAQKKMMQMASRHANTMSEFNIG